MRALSMMLICVFLASCAGGPRPSPDPGVQISRTCEELAADVEGPEWHRGDNSKALLADTTVALEEARGNLAATRFCQGNQRETYAPATKGK